MDGEAPKKLPIYRRINLQKPTKRCTYLIVAVTVLCLIICIVLGVVLSRKSDDCPKGLHCSWHSLPPSEFLKDERCQDSLCTTEACIKSAHYALSRIDPTKDPCEDFYAFACGRYEEEAILFPETSAGVFTYQELENEMLHDLKDVLDSVDETPGKKGFPLRAAKKLYDDCINADQQVPFKEIWKTLFSLDGRLPWPLVNESQIYGEIHVVTMMATTSVLGSNPFFNDLFLISSKKFEWIGVVKPQWIGTLHAIYEDSDDDDAESTYSHYLSILRKIFAEMGVKAADLQTYVQEITKFEKEFLKVAMERRDGEKSDHEELSYTCEELDRSMLNKYWCKMFREVLIIHGLPENNKFGIGFENQREKKYAEAVDRHLKLYSDRVIVNYLALTFVLKYLKFMPSPLRDLYYRYPDVFPPENKLRMLSTRWQQCVEVVTEVLPYPLEKEYLRLKLTKEKRSKVIYFGEQLKKAFISDIDKITWLTKGLGETDGKKLVESLKIVIGRSHILEDDTTLERYMEKAQSELAVLNNPSSLLIADVLELKVLMQKSRMDDNVNSALNKPNFEIFAALAEVEALDVRYGALNFPMFYPGRPMYLEYATLGWYFFFHMSLGPIVSLNAGNSTAFDDVANCLKEELLQLKTGDIDYKIDGIPDEMKHNVLLWSAFTTLGSFQTYKKYLKENGEEKGLPGLPFTNEQLFFIANAQFCCEKFTKEVYQKFPAQLMAPGRYRVNVPFAHSEDFSKAFRCPAGSGMNPTKKCCILRSGKLSSECE